MNTDTDFLTTRHIKQFLSISQDEFQIIIDFLWDICIETPHANLYIERLPNYSDRGRYKWIAESKDNRILTIDGGDMFPRLFFLSESLTAEIKAWTAARNEEEVIKITAPSCGFEFSPDEFKLKNILLKLREREAAFNASPASGEKTDT